MCYKTKCNRTPLTVKWCCSVFSEEVTIPLMPRPAEGGPTSPVRIHEDLADKVRAITSIRKISSANLLEPLIRSFVEKEYVKMLKEGLKSADH